MGSRDGRGGAEQLHRSQGCDYGAVMPPAAAARGAVFARRALPAKRAGVSPALFAVAEDCVLSVISCDALIVGILRREAPQNDGWFGFVVSHPMLRIGWGPLFVLIEAKPRSLDFVSFGHFARDDIVPGSPGFLKTNANSAVRLRVARLPACSAAEAAGMWHKAYTRKAGFAGG